MKLVLEVLNRSLINLKAEKENIHSEITNLRQEIETQLDTLQTIDLKIDEVQSAVSILKESENVVTSKNKKVKSTSKDS
jgi:uncharacterized membrane protein